MTLVSASHTTDEIQAVVNNRFLFTTRPHLKSCLSMVFVGIIPNILFSKVISVT